MARALRVIALTARGPSVASACSTPTGVRRSARATAWPSVGTCSRRSADLTPLSARAARPGPGPTSSPSAMPCCGGMAWSTSRAPSAGTTTARARRPSCARRSTTGSDAQRFSPSGRCATPGWGGSPSARSSRWAVGDCPVGASAGVPYELTRLRRQVDVSDRGQMALRQFGGFALGPFMYARSVAWSRRLGLRDVFPVRRRGAHGKTSGGSRNEGPFGPPGQRPAAAQCLQPDAQRRPHIAARRRLLDRGGADVLQQRDRARRGAGVLDARRLDRLSAQLQLGDPALSAHRQAQPGSRRAHHLRPHRRGLAARRDRVRAHRPPREPVLPVPGARHGTGRAVRVRGVGLGHLRPAGLSADRTAPGTLGAARERRVRSAEDRRAARACSRWAPSTLCSWAGSCRWCCSSSPSTG